jgi:hypothetical protein
MLPSHGCFDVSELSFSGTLASPKKSGPKMRIAVLALAIGLIAPAAGHSWYPLECCSGEDCHETDSVTEMPDGSAQVQVGSDSIVVPRSLKRRKSPDEHYHVCYGKNRESYVVYCFFQPAQS